MSSALAMWAQHRRLSMEANQIKTPNESHPEIGMEKKERRKRSSRTESESSVPPDERRVSIDPALDSEDDETKEHNVQQQEQHHHHHKGHRRFSLDFLFSKKGKNKKEKIQREKIP